MMKKLFSIVWLGMALLLCSSSAFAGVRVEFRDNDGTPISEWMRLEFKIVNDQSTSFDLANSTVRYYFRDTSQTWSTALWSFLVNSLPASTSSITASVAPEPSLPDGWVLTLKFSSGTIGANSNCWVLVGVHNQIWSVNESDDYSYLSGPVFQKDEYVSLYKADTRLFGPKLFDHSGNRAFFTPTSNPFISNVNRGHNSSDPAVGLIPATDAQGNQSDMLYLVTSTDICGSRSCDPNLPSAEITDWAMDGVHLYSTSGPYPANVEWVEYGNLPANSNVIDPILSLKDFTAAGAKQTPKNMFAPDIQYVPPQFIPGSPSRGKLYMYIPMPQASDGSWHIGTASANVNSDGSYDSFVQDPSFFSLSNGPMASPVDPGVFPQVDLFTGEPNGNYFMVYVDASFDQMKNKSPSDRIGNISMAKLNANMISGDFVGKVRFNGSYSHYSRLVNYMEGPDVTVMYSKSRTPRYYMVFTAGEGSNGEGSQLIGYAMADVDCFENTPAASCWNFKGWIFQNLGTGNNHADLVQIQDKYYIFYQQGFTDSGNHRRQVWAKEIALVDNPMASPWSPEDGEIVGVNRAPETSMETLDLYGSLNGTTTWINRDTRYIRNVISDGPVWSYVTLSLTATFDEGVGIYERALKKGSQNQDWFIEDVAEGTRVGNITVPAGAVRIRNMLTSDKRMTCGAAYGSPSDGTTNYGLFNKKLDTSLVNQIWIKEPVRGGSPGAVKLRNLWNNNNSNETYYLTRAKTPGDSDTFCKLPLNSSSVQRQIWVIE